MLKILSKGILSIPNLNLFIKEELDSYNFSKKIDAIAGWGHKASAKKAIALSKRLNVPYIALEDGFVRSFDLGVNNALPMSLSVDTSGCYYDASSISGIEKLIANREWYTDDLTKEAELLISKIKKHEISKYNLSKDIDLSFDIFKDTKDKRLLIIDQTKNDASLLLGAVSDDINDRIIDEILKNYKDYSIFLKVHPDVLCGKKEGLININILKESLDVKVISDNYNAIALLKCFDTVFTATSQMGFEALLLGLEVHCFGVPFYSGYGLTRDHKEHQKIVYRQKFLNVDVKTLFAAAYLKLCRYINPITKQRTTLADVIDILVEQKKAYKRNNRDFVVLNATSWKKELVQAYLKYNKSLIYVNDTKKALELCKEKGATIVQWASKAIDGLKYQAATQGIKTLFIEDGFIRSRGLGSTYEKPMSLVLDNNGIYYDPLSGSDLFSILNNIKTRDDYDFLIAKAKKIREYLVSHNITKYNVGDNRKLDEFISCIKDKAKGREIILVPGQVEDDASVKKAGGLIQTNMELLRKVRENNLNSFILYKPHPDVVALTRKGGNFKGEIFSLYDIMVNDLNISSLYKIVDKVCVLSSQSGFEALLRGKKVEVYGKPFYAGWQLSSDKCAIKGRDAVLSIDDLVAGVLLLYPTYYDWNSGLFARVEDICYRLEHMQERPKDKFLVKLLKLFIALRQKIATRHY